MSRKTVILRRKLRSSTLEDLLPDRQVRSDGKTTRVHQGGGRTKRTPVLCRLKIGENKYKEFYRNSVTISPEIYDRVGGFASDRICTWPMRAEKRARLKEYFYPKKNF